MSDSIKLSIAIVNWNVRDLLANCLRSLDSDPLAQGAEMIVVDNASSDGSVDMLRTAFPGVRLIQNDENVGFARANNQAIRESRGEYILLLNPDTKVVGSAVMSLAQFLDQRQDVGAVGPRLLNADGSLQQGCYPRPTLLREFWRLFNLDRLWPLGVYPMEAWALDEPRPVDALMGACLMLRRQALDHVGLLSQDYFMFSEEVDLCYRLQQAHWQLVWVPQARVVHYGGQSTKQVADDMFLQLYQGKVLYFRKNHGWATAKMYKLIVAAAALARLVVGQVPWLVSSGRRGQQSMLVSRYRQLLAALPGM